MAKLLGEVLGIKAFDKKIKPWHNEENIRQFFGDKIVFLKEDSEIAK